MIEQDDEVEEIRGRRWLVLRESGRPLKPDRGAHDLVEAALNAGAAAIAVPVGRLDPAFFDLATGFAGDVLQKAVNYRLTLAIVGDVAPYAQRSEAFRDLLVEARRGGSTHFVADMGELAARLAPAPPTES